MGVVGVAGSRHPSLPNTLPTASAALSPRNSPLCPFPAGFQQHLGKGIPWGSLLRSPLPSWPGNGAPPAPGLRDRSQFALDEDDATQHLGLTSEAQAAGGGGKGCFTGVGPASRRSPPPPRWEG